MTDGSSDAPEREPGDASGSTTPPAPAMDAPPLSGQPASGQPAYGQPAYGQPATRPGPSPYTPPYTPPYGPPPGAPGPWQAPGYVPYAPPGYVRPGYPGPPAARPAQPSDPTATAALLIGIGAIVAAPPSLGVALLAAPVAWILGARTRRRIEAAGGPARGRQDAHAGMVLGIIGTALLLLAVVAVVLLVVLGFSTDGWDTIDGEAGTAV